MSVGNAIIDTMTTEDKVKAIADWYSKWNGQVEFEDYIAENEQHLQLCWYVENNFVSLKEFGVKLIDLFYPSWEQYVRLNS